MDQEEENDDVSELEMDVEIGPIAISDQPPNSLSSPIVLAREDIMTDSDEEDDEDDEFVSSGSDEVMVGPRIISALLNRTAVQTTSANSFWNTLIPPSFLPRSTVRRGGRVSKSLRVFSVAMLPHARPELENGGKMILPPSFLSALTMGVAQLESPMLFRVQNNATNKFTHCGVLEFIADEGRCYMPFWRMHNIGANEGDLVTVESTTTQVGRFALFEPQSVDFLDITNPKALLENTLRNFTCITKGETIVIHYNNRMYELKVLDTKPTDAINIVECDMEVDFAPAVGLPQDFHPNDESDQGEVVDGDSFVPFIGAGSRLDGKAAVVTPSTTIRHAPRGTPDFEWKPGKLNFSRKIRKRGNIAVPTNSGFKAFGGEGSVLK